MGDVFASPNGKFQVVLEIEQYNSTIASTSVPMILRIGRPIPFREKGQRSFQIVHPDDNHGDAWVHFISTLLSKRMKDKKIEISTNAQQEASSLAGC